jgi:hypothetical protein
MRFTKLAVEAFQGIRRAEVEFGPGLNVLYGPNDLGKSTLATALRAALLVTPSSTESLHYAPWYADATPYVSLSFADDSEHYWKVNKRFGSAGANTTAELLHSKDNVSFSLDCKAREVEERLRALLAWGIPAPGGKGGPRGLPTSFLANVLLAAQTDVDTILGKSLAEDIDTTGELRLTKALAALAQDPLFKTVFDAAQREVDQCFTPTGKRKRGQASKFMEADRVIKQLQAELSALERQMADSAAIEDTVAAHLKQRDEALTRVAEAEASLAALRGRLAATKAREEARVRLEAAKHALGLIDAHAASVTARSVEVEALTAAAKLREEDMSRALGEVSLAEAALRDAEEAHRVATSDDGVRERELRRAQLATQAAELNLRRQAAETRRTAAVAAVARAAEAQAARVEADAVKAASEEALKQLEKLRQRTTHAEADVELKRASLAYGRWQAAALAAKQATSAAQTAETVRREAAEKDAAASALEDQARAIEEALTQQRADLPDEANAKQLDQLQRELEIAEAALGGGLSVRVRPRTGVHVHAVVDQNEVIDEPSLAVERAIEAERSVRLSLGELVDIEISAGAADKRKAAFELRARWNSEAVPVLARARLASVAELLGALTVVTKMAAEAADLTRRAAQLRTDAKACRERAAEHEATAAKGAANASDLAQRKRAIGPTDPQLLQKELEKLGTAWESKTDAQHTKALAALKTLQAELAAQEQQAKVAEYRVADTEQHAVKLASTAAAALAALGAAEAGPLLRSIDEELAALSAREAELVTAGEALLAEASGKVEGATRAVEAAQAQLGTVREAHQGAVATAEAAKAELNARIGERNALKTQLEAMDRAGAAALCEQREAELRALPASPVTSEEDVANAERACVETQRELEAANEELHKSEGALSKVGGAAVREEVERVREAIEAATTREKELEIDADAWKLLRDTLRAVENEEGSHLGRALAGPVATKFGELTAGRYKNLRLDAKLKTEALDAATGVVSGATVLSALSVGTRDQLATLIRVTIASQLKTTIVLDDHLVHTDPKRLLWFRDVLLKTALSTQVIVLTCRPEDYLSRNELPEGVSTRDLAGGTIRAIDMTRVVSRWVEPTIGG